VKPKAQREWIKNSAHLCFPSQKFSQLTKEKISKKKKKEKFQNEKHKKRSAHAI
jgi:hypothetical protein